MVSSEDIVEIALAALKEGGQTPLASDPNKENKSGEGPACQNVRRDPERKGKWGLILRQSYNKPYTSLPPGRVFITEHDAKQRGLREKTFSLPRAAILSPLAEEWLNAKGIKIVRG